MEHIFTHPTRYASYREMIGRRRPVLAIDNRKMEYWEALIEQALDAVDDRDTPAFSRLEQRLRRAIVEVDHLLAQRPRDPKLHLLLARLQQAAPDTLCCPKQLVTRVRRATCLAPEDPAVLAQAGDVLSLCSLDHNDIGLWRESVRLSRRAHALRSIA